MNSICERISYKAARHLKTLKKTSVGTAVVHTTRSVAYLAYKHVETIAAIATSIGAYTLSQSIEISHMVGFAACAGSLSFLQKHGQNNAFIQAVKQNDFDFIRSQCESGFIPSEDSFIIDSKFILYEAIESNFNNEEMILYLIDLLPPDFHFFKGSLVEGSLVSKKLLIAEKLIDEFRKTDHLDLIELRFDHLGLCVETGKVDLDTLQKFLKLCKKHNWFDVLTLFESSLKKCDPASLHIQIALHELQKVKNQLQLQALLI